jgi:uncharacterized lipoprotein YddW (UPF0748 family)
MTIRESRISIKIGCFVSALLTCLTLSGTAQAQPATSALPIRGVWIPTPDHTSFWTSRASIDKHLDDLSAAGINSVFVVMWNQGRTFYPSKVMEGLTGIAIDERMKGRDPLREIVESAKPRKMRVYAWFEFGFATDVRGGKGSEIAPAKPAWMAQTSTGQPLVKNGFRWLNALDPAVQDFMLSLLMEVVDGYDVTGIQGDDRLPALPVEGGYNLNVVAAYRAAHEGREPPANHKDKAWVQWRSDRLSQFMQRIFAETKKRKPTMQVAMAPSVFPFSRDEYLQDWPTWVKNGWVDLVSPQLYRKDMLHYQSAVNAVVNKQVAAADLHKVAPGVLLNLGKSYAASAELLKQMVEANRKAGITGEVFFYNEGVGERAQVFREIHGAR